MARSSEGMPHYDHAVQVKWAMAARKKIKFYFVTVLTTLPPGWASACKRQYMMVIMAV